MWLTIDETKSAYALIMDPYLSMWHYHEKAHSEPSHMNT